MCRVVHRAVCACCLLGVRVVCVHPSCVWGVARGLTALAFASTPSLRERPRCTARRTFRIHTPPTSVRAVPGSRATCSPLDCRELRQRQQGVSILASQTSWAWLGNADVRSAPMPVVVVALIPRGLYSNSPGGPHHPCVLYSTEARDSETHPRDHGSRLKTPVSPSSNPVDGKECVSSAHVRDRG